MEPQATATVDPGLVQKDIQWLQSEIAPFLRPGKYLESVVAISNGRIVNLKLSENKKPPKD